MIKNLLFITVCAIFLCSCGIGEEEKTPQAGLVTITENTPEAVYRKISADEARDIMDSSEKYILLDVRTEEEYKEQRIENAILLPDYEIADNAESVLPDKEALILVYCRSGRRSADASYELISMGYSNVYDFGGINGWPYETIRNCQIIS